MLPFLSTTEWEKYKQKPTTLYRQYTTISLLKAILFKKNPDIQVSIQGTSVYRCLPLRVFPLYDLFLFSAI